MNEPTNFSNALTSLWHTILIEFFENTFAGRSILGTAIWLANALDTVFQWKPQPLPKCHEIGTIITRAIFMTNEAMRIGDEIAKLREMPWNMEDIERMQPIIKSTAESLELLIGILRTAASIDSV